MAQNLSSVVENSYFDFEKPFRISFLKRDTVDAVFTLSQFITLKSSQWRFNAAMYAKENALYVPRIKAENKADDGIDVPHYGTVMLLFECNGK